MRKILVLAFALNVRNSCVTLLSDFDEYQDCEFVVDASGGVYRLDGIRGVMSPHIVPLNLDGVDVAKCGYLYNDMMPLPGLRHKEYDLNEIDEVVAFVENSSQKVFVTDVLAIRNCMELYWFEDKPAKVISYTHVVPYLSNKDGKFELQDFTTMYQAVIHGLDNKYGGVIL